jgi:hypothetical protein
MEISWKEFGIPLIAEDVRGTKSIEIARASE